MPVYHKITELIGNTPLMSLDRYSKAEGLKSAILAKLEMFNPAGSAKDRVALQMIRNAEQTGELRPGSVIIEPTSGNTGIGLSYVVALEGYDCIIVMPDSMSEERRKLIAAYGAKIVLTPGAQGMNGAIAKAKELKEQTPGSIIAGQFTNPANVQAHYETTGPEIWRDTQGKIDVFVAGVGTGGTITGVGRFLREQNPNIHIVAVEPVDSSVLSGGKAGSHGLQGIGAGFIPEILDTSLFDEIITVSTQEAYAAAGQLRRQDGILAGISSGAALYAATALATRSQWVGKTVVTLLPDTGDRYLSVPNFI